MAPLALSPEAAESATPATTVEQRVQTLMRQGAWLLPPTGRYTSPTLLTIECEPSHPKTALPPWLATADQVPPVSAGQLGVLRSETLKPWRTLSQAFTSQTALVSSWCLRPEPSARSFAPAPGRS